MQPAPTANHRTRPTQPHRYGSRPVYRVSRRRALLAVSLTLAFAYAALSVASSLPADNAWIANDQHRAYVSPNHYPGGSAVGWPLRGEAALVLGAGRPAVSPQEQPVAIASLAKVMTAYLTLERYPLSSAQDGFTIIVTAAEAQDAAQDRAEGQSVLAVAAGERLTERQLLEGLLIPSGNNVAELLATVIAGSETGFVAEMNAQARALGMGHTTYTDPSGFDPNTVSTAADQLRVFQAAMRFSVFDQIVSMGSVTLPVAGTVTNFDPLITEGYAGKTGSDAAAGGCLAFFTDVSVGGRRETAVGVVLGQGQSSDTQALLAAAGQTAEQLIGSATAEKGTRTRVAGGRRGVADGYGRHPLLPVPLSAQP
jgi:serine-type D-Ala-D-Ala carboxypeptidase (penicillin-binding protein 5/6)